MNKYFDFFTQLRDFYVDHGLANTEAFHGLSVEDCESLEIQNSIIFDESLQAYLMVFGKGIEIPKFKGYSLFDLHSINEVQKVVEQRKKDGNVINSKILKIVSLDSLTTQQLSKPLSSVVFLSYDEIGDCYTIIEEGSQNPYLYAYFDNADSLFFQNYRLNEYVRSIFANHIIWFCRDNKWSSSNQAINSLLKLDWIQFYRAIEDNNIFWTRISGHRTRYRNESENSRISNDNLLDFNAGEEDFIEYLLRNNCI